VSPRRILARALVRSLAIGLLGLAACEREPHAWLADLLTDDPWHRRVAAQALRAADPGQVEAHLHGLLFVLDDPDPRVRRAARESLEILAPRAVNAIARVLRTLPPHRRELRHVLLATLRRLAEAGDADARREFATLLRFEVEGPNPRRAEIARQWPERFE
jgi:hypothetical protein